MENNNIWHQFHGPNVAYILDLYDQYLADARSVDDATRRFFESWQPPTEEVITQAAIDSPDIEKVMAAVNLAQAIREYGHLAARLDPLGSEPPGDPTLDPASYNLTEADLRGLPVSLVGGPIAERSGHAAEAIRALQAVYSTHIGYDFDHLRQPEEREWLRQAVETGRFRPPQDPIHPMALLNRLTQVETFEQFLHRIFPGKTRFSIEGLDMLVPMLDEIVGAAAESGIYAILLGMAHRGRLNVLAHILNKSYAQILAEFKDPVKGHNLFIHEDLGWTGDVKYHLGARRALDGGRQVDLVVSIAPNPSHLEAVNPVVEGMARAAGTTIDSRAHLALMGRSRCRS
jgi:2-oxoglutarate dehydrogenase E1 component